MYIFLCIKKRPKLLIFSRDKIITKKKVLWAYLCQIELLYFEERFVLPLIHFIDIFVSLVSLPLDFVQIFQHEFVLYLDLIWSAGWDQFLSNLQPPIVLDFAIDWFVWNYHTSAWIRDEQDIRPTRSSKLKGCFIESLKLVISDFRNEHSLPFFYFENYTLTTYFCRKWAEYHFPIKYQEMEMVQYFL